MTKGQPSITQLVSGLGEQLTTGIQRGTQVRESQLNNLLKQRSIEISQQKNDMKQIKQFMDVGEQVFKTGGAKEAKKYFDDLKQDPVNADLLRRSGLENVELFTKGKGLGLSVPVVVTEKNIDQIRKHAPGAQKGMIVKPKYYKGEIIGTDIEVGLAGKAGKPRTKTQLENEIFANRIENSLNIITGLETAGFDIRTGTSFVGQAVPERFKGENRKKLEQAKRDITNAILRRESGAAISESEFESAEKQYFPQVGDTKGVIEQKIKNINIVLEGLKGRSVEQGVSGAEGEQGAIRSLEFETQEDVNAAFEKGEVDIGDEIVLGGRRFRLK